ncbi:DNA methylase [Candidatus Woesearchaeota archaeon CG10_big_fil_rev_8_21_14_0_10_44_13]|nr:MAG: DNA methylase [Candidatus Woesearchaeota archaeon CG10_big_fil_rev_8_21_14_0_10_44_13]
MPYLNSKSRLAIELSKLKVFENPDVKTEQYPMDSEFGAEVLWDAYFKGDIENKAVADLGCGTGILGIGALLLGAKLVYFVDSDEKAIAIAKENLSRFTILDKDKAVFIVKDVNDFKENVDTVIQNPPFGTKQKHADRDFLMKAFEISDSIYSFHKATSKNFIEKISSDNGFRIANYYGFDFPLKASQLFHKKNIHRIKVGCWRLVREQKRL